MAIPARNHESDSMFCCKKTCGAIVLTVFTITSGPQAFAVDLKTDTKLPTIKLDENHDWTLRFGVGSGIAPTYEGSDDYKLVPVPVLDIGWRGRVFIGTGGLGVNVIRNEWVTVSTRLTYDGGRDEDDDDALRGLGDIDATVEAEIFGKLRYKALSLSASLRQDIADSHDGMIGRAAFAYSATITKKLSGTFGPSITWANVDYMQSFFGITANQSIRSGLRQFSADSGIKDYGLNGTVTYEINNNWVVTGIGRYTRLTGDAADSPITRDENQFFAGAFVAYQF